MAHYWNMLREEVKATVDDFRVKGAVGAFKDAALDVRDMAAETGGSLWNGVKALAGDDKPKPVIHLRGVPMRGTAAPLEFPDGRVQEATVMGVDAVSDPWRVSAQTPDMDAPILVGVVDHTKDLVGAVARAPQPPLQGAQVKLLLSSGLLIQGVVKAVDSISDPPRVSVTITGESEPLLVPFEICAEGEEADGGLLNGLKQEWNQTVQEFKEKGAIGAVKDASLDAVDLLGLTATSAINGAKSLAKPILSNGGAPVDGAAAPEGGAGGATGGPSQLSLLEGLSFDGIKEELRGTVRDFREKGAVGAVKDATLDAVDIVTETATSAFHGAKSLAGGLVKAGDAGTQAAGAGASAPAMSAAAAAPTAQATPAAAPTSYAPTPSAAPAPTSAPVPAPAAARKEEAPSPAPAVAPEPVVAPAPEPAPAATEAPAQAKVPDNAAGAAAAAGAPAEPAAQEAPKEPEASAPAEPAAPAEQAAPSKPEPTPAAEVKAAEVESPKEDAKSKVAAPPPKAAEPGVMRKSLVSMRRSLFERKKKEEEPEPAKPAAVQEEEEEHID